MRILKKNNMHMHASAHTAALDYMPPETGIMGLSLLPITWGNRHSLLYMRIFQHMCMSMEIKPKNNTYIFQGTPWQTCTEATLLGLASGKEVLGWLAASAAGTAGEAAGKEVLGKVGTAGASVVTGLVLPGASEEEVGSGAATSAAAATAATCSGKASWVSLPVEPSEAEAGLASVAGALAGAGSKASSVFVAGAGSRGTVQTVQLLLEGLGAGGVAGRFAGEGLACSSLLGAGKQLLTAKGFSVSVVSTLPSCQNIGACR